MRKLLPEAIIVCAIMMVVSYGFAQTWTQTSSNSPSPWSGIACSADGKVVIAVKSTAKPLISLDSGNTWITNANATSPPNGFYCAASADGQLFVSGSSSSGYYMSADLGNTWVHTNAPNGISIAAFSADWVKIFGITGNAIWISTNSGSTWLVSSAPSKQWGSLASSADGTTLIGSGSGQIYISTNSGNNWTLAAAGADSVAISADGNILVGTQFTGYHLGIPLGGTYISTNSGGSWMTNAIIGRCVASSADGKRLFISDYFSRLLYTSTDFGITWVTNSVPFSLNSFVSSADGCRLFATSSGQGIWVGQITPSPQLSLAPADTNLALSWLVPSTNFVLQENLDLTTTNWVTLTNTPTLNLTNLQNQVMLSPTNDSGFFRLMAQ